jgi:HD-GYP domain-containing protein (c-di-GMP phosphodiesterase class II)
MRIIQEEAGHQFDPHVVDAFNQVIDHPRDVFHFVAPSKSIVSSATVSDSDKANDAEDIGARCGAVKPL